VAPTMGSGPRGARRPRRILHLTREFPPLVWGGLGTAVGGLAQASARAGMEVAVLLVRQSWPGGYPGEEADVEEPSPMVDVQASADGAVRILSTSWEGATVDAVGFLARWGPDLLHVHPVELWPLARELVGLTAIPLVYTAHSVNIAEYAMDQGPTESLNLWRLQQEMVRAADRVIAVSRSEAELLVRLLPEIRHRVRVAGHGIEEPGPPPPRAPAGRDGPMVLYVGRFVNHKGVGDLLQAVPSVLACVPDCRFVLVGGYGSAEWVERTWLPPSLSAFRDRIAFTGWLGPGAIGEWYARADVLVVPSRYEPFGMVVLEGMARGLAIAASRVGGPAEILEHGRTGLLFPPADPLALARTVVRLLLDPALRASLGQAAREEVRRKWTWARAAERVHSVYREIAGVTS
jgi:glycosyltransferase involved in cell wall biosynthesis